MTSSNGLEKQIQFGLQMKQIQFLLLLLVGYKYRVLICLKT